MLGNTDRIVLSLPKSRIPAYVTPSISYWARVRERGGDILLPFLLVMTNCFIDLIDLVFPNCRSRSHTFTPCLLEKEHTFL